MREALQLHLLNVGTRVVLPLEAEQLPGALHERPVLSRDVRERPVQLRDRVALDHEAAHSSVLLGALQAEDAALPLQDGPYGVAHRHEPREGLHGDVEGEVGRDHHGPLGDVLLEVDAVVRVPEAQPDPVLARLEVAPGGQQVEVPRLLALRVGVLPPRAHLGPALRGQLQKDLPNPPLEHRLL